MEFTGLPLSTLLPLGLAAGLATVVLYILKLKRRAVPVVFSPIWRQVLKEREASSWFDRLKRLLSLLFQLALLMLLFLALADPKPTRDTQEARHFVVLLDASASMKATDVSPSRLHKAKSEVRELIHGLGASDQMLIAQMDMAVTPLSTMTADPAELEGALDRLKASDTRADLMRGLRFGLDSLRGLSHPEVILVSDGAFPDTENLPKLPLGGTKITHLPVGKSGQNLAITQFSVRRYPLDKSRYEALLEITNMQDAPAEVELSLYGDGQIVDVTRLHLKPNERLPRFYQELAGASQTLEAVLRAADGSKDMLPADNHAYALMPERRRARVLVVTPGNTYLEATLLLDEYLDVTLMDPKKYPPKARFDVTIFDSVAPTPAQGSGSLLYLNPPEDNPVVKLGRPIEDFGFDRWDKKSPILSFIAPGDIQVARGFALKPGPDDHVVGASELGPILVSGQRQGQKFIALGFDPRDSDFVLRVAWPLFVLNSINSFIQEDVRYISSYRTGDVWRIPAPESAKLITLVEPNGQRRSVPVRQGRAVYWGDRAGFYKLEVEGKPPDLFAANLVDPTESRIKPVTDLRLFGKKLDRVSGFSKVTRRQLWLYLLLAVVVLSAVEWFTYHKRITV